MAAEQVTRELELYLEKADISFSSPTSEDFATYQASFTGPHENAVPRIITRPRTPENVASIVKYCVDANLPIVVRGGGHDMFGRFTAAGAVSIDLRGLKGVTISADRKTAAVRGATTVLEVLEALKGEKLITPVGNCGWVGMIGWALQGGIGPYTMSYGLGCDSMIGARVVNAKGHLVDADEGMLKALRGGGGNIGVVVEATVKLYPQEEVQAGFMLWDTSDVTKSMTTFLTQYNEMLTSTTEPIPRKLSVIPHIWMVPGQGLALMCGIVWNGPSSESSEFTPWLEKVANLATPVPDAKAAVSSIKPSTAHDYASLVASFLVPSVRGRSQTAAATEYTPEIISTIASAAASLPSDAAGGIVFHSTRADTPFFGDTPAARASVCPYREPMHVLEILGLGSDEKSADSAAEWSLKTRESLSDLKGSMKRTYLPLTAPEAVDLKEIYGGKLGELKALKETYDPSGVFAHALPKLV